MRPLHILLLVTLAVTLIGTNAFAADASGPILTNLLGKVRSLRSYHYVIESTGVMEPRDSGFLYKMKTVSSCELWARRTDGTTLLCQTGRTSLTPPEHPEARSSFTNLSVFDGNKQYLLKPLIQCLLMTPAFDASLSLTRRPCYLNCRRTRRSGTSGKGS